MSAPLLPLNAAAAAGKETRPVKVVIHIQVWVRSVAIAGDEIIAEA